jgi:photosystem II stability/assembly factor-like uncharacterized protein
MTSMQPLRLFVILAAVAAPIAAGPQSWTPIGPDGGLVQDLAADPVHPGVFYAACYDGGIFATRDGGATWTPANRGLGELGGFLTVAVDPTAPNRVFAGNFTGVFLSLDFAATWSPLSTPLAEVYALAISATDGTIYAAGSQDYASSTIAISHDGGLTWAPSSLAGTHAQALLLAPGGSGEVLYAATDFVRHGHPYLYRSRDGGRSWAALHTGIPLEGPFDRVALANDNTHGVLFLSVSLAGHSGAVVKTITARSADGGNSWQRVTPAGEPVGVSGDGAVIVDSSRSLDGGLTWTPVPTPPSPNRFLGDPFAPQTLFVGSSPGGIYRSTDDGASWQPWRQELASTYVSALVAGPHLLWAAVANGDLETASTGLDDSSIEWVPSSSGLPPEAFTQGGPPAIALDPHHPRIMYFAWPGAQIPGPSSAAGGVARSGNAGHSWHLLQTGSWYQFVPVGLDVDPMIQQMLYLHGSFARTASSAGCAILSSKDSGTTWECIDPANSLIDAFAVAAQGAGRLYALGPAGPDYLQVHVFRSNDHGSSWTDLPVFGLAGVRYTHSLVVDPTNSDHVLVIGDDSVYKSADGGQHWQRLGRGLPNLLYSVVFDPIDPTCVYALGHLGVYASRNSGASFQPLYGGLPTGDNGFVPVLALDPADPHRLFVSLGGHGVYAFTRP